MKTDQILYGGDYNPEQWPEDIWPEDMRLMKEAGVNILTLNVFSWAALQPAEEVYDFRRLDRVLALAKENGMQVCMATSTAAHPAWMAKKYPEILRTDFGGIRRKFGGRHNSCPNSAVYRTMAARLAGKLAEHYKEETCITAWHISNEYGGACYCENCEAAFRVWLREKYHTLDALNAAWDTAVWSHTFYDWDEIVLPDTRSEYIDENRTQFPVITLDYRRFMSDSMLACFCLEKEAIRAQIPDARVTTNFMGFYENLDYQKWAQAMDFVSWDNYPSNEASYAEIGMSHDLMRSLKQGQSFALMEQTPSVTNWLPYNALKRPGMMRLLSWQAVAHGSDTVMFFQMRRSTGGCEMLHGALIDHVGTDQTRVFREAARLGRELAAFGGCTLGARTPARAAILFSWENWWAIDACAGPSQDLSYLPEVQNYYTALREMNIDTDLISPGDDLSKYRLILAPYWFMVKEEWAEAARAFVSGGGILVITCFSGIVDENDLAVTGGYPGKLKNLAGIWVEESDALPEGTENSFLYQGNRYPARILCDLLHLSGAAQMDLGGFERDFYRGCPVITRNLYGSGACWYIATTSSRQFYHDFLQDLCGQAGIRPVLTASEGVEVTCRENEGGRYYFILNYTDRAQTVYCPWETEDLLKHTVCPAGIMEIKAKDVMILRQETGKQEPAAI